MTRTLRKEVNGGKRNRRILRGAVRVGDLTRVKKDSGRPARIAPDHAAGSGSKRIGSAPAPTVTMVGRSSWVVAASASVLT
ncbi:MAG: hypothetical protein RJA44_1539 [Pseudomonadota bacterium]